MFWISCVVIAMSTLLVKLGALSVMTAVLSVSLKASLVLVVALSGVLVWRWYKNTKNR